MDPGKFTMICQVALHGEVLCYQLYKGECDMLNSLVSICLESGKSNVSSAIICPKGRTILTAVSYPTKSLDSQR